VAVGEVLRSEPLKLGDQVLGGLPGQCARTVPGRQHGDRSAQVFDLPRLHALDSIEQVFATVKSYPTLTLTLVVLHVLIACGAIVFAIGLAVLVGRPRPKRPSLSERLRRFRPRSVSDEAEEWLKCREG
jgi:hypothetical protein